MSDSKVTPVAQSSLHGSLRSQKSAKRLELISKLRALGIGEHVGLPQIVVCGDQSAGKSSVLEGLTGIPFPRQDGLCTTFATEIILQHTLGDTSVLASIIPAKTRSIEDKNKLRAFNEQRSLEELPSIIDAAGKLMGVRKPGVDESGPAFVSDVLSIQVQGPHGMHLSVVDLPGLISVASEYQTNEDVDTVHQLVNDYVADSRTIILAVVQATNDISNQAIIRKSKEFDSAGERTVGIITKPDLINKGTEGRIALLASNKDTTKLKLGFFLVKNPAPHKITNEISMEKRFENETHYFQSPQWAQLALDPERTGTPALRTFLQDLLERHIEGELPKVRDEIKTRLRNTEQVVADMVAAANGIYVDQGAAFFAETHQQSRRLRAVIQKMNSEYSKRLRVRGQKRKVVQSRKSESDSETCVSDPDTDDCIMVSEHEMKKWIQEVYENCRGKELAGTYNYVLLADLFREQASPWYSIAEDHVRKVDSVIREIVKGALAHAVIDNQVLAALNDLAEHQLERNLAEAITELNKLWEDEQNHPMTYNHYFTDNIQKRRNAVARDNLERAMKGTLSAAAQKTAEPKDSKLTTDTLLKGLQQRATASMDEQAYEEASDSLNAYYKVARKTFVDNVCRQVIERHLMRKLFNLFSPDVVAEMDDAELAQVAAETSKRAAKRGQLQTLQKDLATGLAELKGARFS